MRFTSLILALLVGLSACAASPTTAPTDTPGPLSEPSPTRQLLTVTPVESAFAPENPTAAPLEEILATHAVTFRTSDGATLNGELYGSGETAVIFSVMGNCKPGWREFAWLTAEQGLMAITYPWRGCRDSQPANESELRKFVEDARAAISFAREQGAEKIILVGASLGGLASARLATESQASGIVVVASPARIVEWDFEIEAADLNTDVPKLFISAEKDAVVPFDEARELFDLAAEPKEWQTYPGTAHGTDLFEGENGEEMAMRILEFILAIAKP